MSGITVPWRAYWHVFSMAAREDRANPLRLIGSVGLGIVRMIMIAAIYKVAYGVMGSSQLGYENAVWSIGLYFALVMGLSIRNVFKAVEQEVRSGTVEVTLLRPLDWRLVKVLQLLGHNVLEAGLLIIGFLITLCIVVGLPDMSYFTVGFVGVYVGLLFLSIVSTAAIFLSVGLAAFWLNDSTSVYRIVDRVLMVFGGAFVPIALLPEVVQTILRYSPFGIYGAATQLFNPILSQHLIPTFIASVGWSIVLVLLCQLLWRRAERRIEVNGG